MIFNYLMRTLLLIPKAILAISLIALSTQSIAGASTGQSIDDSQNLKGLTSTALKEAINAYEYAVQKQNVANNSVLTVVNFTEPSYKRRLWVIDTKTGNVLLAMHVAQGKNTGLVDAEHFSNAPGSNASSPGIYITAGQYDGKHGKSMRIDGIEAGINSNAMRRAIVIHPAWYVTPNFIKQHGYAGRSWGCFAVNPNQLNTLLHYVDHRSVLFAYAPSENHDSNVSHSLSSNGKTLYSKIAQHLSNGDRSSHGLLKKVKSDLSSMI